MARSFNGTSDHLTSAATLAGLASAPRIAVSFWRYVAAGGQPDTMTLEYGPNAFGATDGTFALYNDGGSGLPLIWLNAPTHDHYGFVATAPTAAAWHHWLINFDMTLPGGQLEIQSVYIDGTLQSLTNTDGSDFSNVGATFANETLHVMSNGPGTLFQNGRLADLCIWTPGSVLSASDATTLADGARANTVRAGEIAYYWPLLGAESPEPAAIGGTAMTVTGATYVDDPPTLASPLGPLAFTAARVDDTTVSIAWDDTDVSITAGVTVVRASGDLSTTADAAGNVPGDHDYDPTTIVGVTEVATGVTSSPHSDTVPSAGTYTYWINRSA